MRARGNLGRREFLAALPRSSMAAGLAAAFAGAAFVAGRFLLGAERPRRGWHCLGPASSLRTGETLAVRTPAGTTVQVLRTGKGESAADFRALSAICPHLGCTVRWDPARQQFRCPCHQGAFDARGRGVAGPPAGRELLPRRLKVEKGLLFLEVVVEPVAPSPIARLRARSVR